MTTTETAGTKAPPRDDPPGQVTTTLVLQPGFVVTAIVYVFGVGILFSMGPSFFGADADTPPALLLGTTGAALVFAFIGLTVPRSSTAVSGRTTPAVPTVAIVSFVAGFAFNCVALGLVYYVPRFGRGAMILVPIAGTLLIAGATTWLVARWRATSGFADRHRLAVAGGALVAHTSFGVWLVARTPVNRIGLLGAGIVMIVLLLLLARRVRARSSPAAGG